MIDALSHKETLMVHTFKFDHVTHCVLFLLPKLFMTPALITVSTYYIYKAEIFTWQEVTVKRLRWTIYFKVLINYESP